MKKTLMASAILLAAAMEVNAQATLPSIMVRPGNQWCADNGFMKIEDVQGQQKRTYDRIGALNNPEMLQCIAAISGLLEDNGLEPDSMEGQDESLDNFIEEEDYIVDEEGNTADKDALDVSRERVTADINLDVNWSIKSVGPKKQLSYTLIGKDFYTGKFVCSITGLGEPSMAASEATLLREAVIGKMPELVDELERYFSRILENGRSVQVGIRVSTGSTINLKSIIGDETLDGIIYQWIFSNAVQHRAKAGPSSLKTANYSVNIPLYLPNGIPMQTHKFVEQLSIYLSSEYKIKTMVSNQGLGKALLYIQGRL